MSTVAPSGGELDPSQYSSEAKGLRTVSSSAAVQGSQSASFKLLQRALESDGSAALDGETTAVATAAETAATNGMNRGSVLHEAAVVKTVPG